MERLEGMFWMLFVLVEAFVIAEMVLDYSDAYLLIGFVTVLIGLARACFFIFRNKVSKDLDDSKRDIRRLSNWMNNEHEALKGIRHLTDTRIHKLDHRIADHENDLENRYRDLVAKIIEIENRMNVLSRALVTRETVKIVIDTFEGAWDDIKKICGEKKHIETTARKVRNRIVKVTDNGITMVSGQTGSTREVKKEEVRHFWDVLERRKVMRYPQDVDKPEVQGKGSVIISMLALLPRVEYQTRPRVLYLMPAETHAPGTLRKRK